MDLVSEIKKIPPVTRFLCLGTIGITGAAKLGIINIYWIFYHTDLVLQKFQVWGPISRPTYRDFKCSDSY
jgi:Derlin-2/3